VEAITAQGPRPSPALLDNAGHAVLSANDPKRSSARISCWNSEAGFSSYQGVHLCRYDAIS
jgi:hypothetical protein